METKNTPQEQTNEEFNLTEKEQKQLEEYQGENAFLQSISQKYKEYGKLTPKQVVAFRNQGDKKPSLSECPNTKVQLKQKCIFIDKKTEPKQRQVEITVIRQKALCMFDKENNQYAWVPSKAVKLEVGFSENSEGEMTEETALFLQDWFTRNDDFWKESKPLNSQKEEVKEEVKEEIKEESNHDLPEYSEQENEDDELPF